jgi:hypothetical protein
MIMATRREVLVDVEPDQVWRERDGDQHWKVFAVHNQVRPFSVARRAGKCSILGTR